MSDLKTSEIMGRLAALKNNPKAVMAIAAVVFILDISLVLRYQWVSVSRLFKEVGQLRANIGSTRDDTKLSPTFKTRAGELKKEIEDLNKMMIFETDLPNAIESISKFADVAAVRILRIRPVIDVAAARNAITQAPLDFARQKVTISAKAGFHQLGRFLALLENAPVFFDVKSVEIQTDQHEYMKHVVTIVLEVVIKKV